MSSLKNEGKAEGKKKKRDISPPSFSYPCLNRLVIKKKEVCDAVQGESYARPCTCKPMCTPVARNLSSSANNIKKRSKQECFIEKIFSPGGDQMGRGETNRQQIPTMLDLLAASPLLWRERWSGGGYKEIGERAGKCCAGKKEIF